MPEVTIVIKTIDDSSAKVKNVKKEYEGIFPALEKAGRGVTDFISKNATLIAGVVAVGAAVGKAYQDFQKYAGEVRDLSIATGTGAEETSRFLQVLDDYQLTAADATAASRALKEKGLVPNIDTLATLADKYKEIKDPAERMAFVQENLGRGGAKWVNVLNQQSDALRDQASQVSKNLILSDEQIKKAERERLAMDALGDSWEGFKIQVGAAAGELVLAAKESTDFTTRVREYAKAHDIATNNTVAMQIAVKAVKEEMSKEGEAAAIASSMLMNQSRVMKEYGQVVEGEVMPTLEDLTQTNRDYLASIGDLSDELKDNAEKENELKDEHAELLAEKTKLISQGWWAESEAVQEINSKLAENEEAQSQNADAFEENTHRRMLAALEEKLAIDGLTEGEKQRLEELGVKWGVYTEEAITKAQKEREAIDLIAEGINNLPEGKSIDVVLNAIANIPQGALAGDVQAMEGGYGYAASKPDKSYAEGGIAAGPSSGHWELLHGTEAVIPLQSGSVPVQMKDSGNSEGNDAAMSDMQAMLAGLIRSLPDMLIRAQKVAMAKG